MIAQRLETKDRNLIASQNANAQSRKEARLNRNNGGQIKNGSINMNELNGKLDSVLIRKQRAQKKAMKVVGDAWAADKKIDLKIQERIDRIQEFKKNIDENMGLIRDYKMCKEDLRETYGINADSQEQKDLELMEKAGLHHVLLGREYKIADMLWYAPFIEEVNLDVLTKEEQERLAEIADESLTEYQLRAMKVDGRISGCDIEIDKAHKKIMMENDEIRAIKNERLKDHTMVDAQKEAKEIMEDAGKEAIGILIGESKDHIDEKIEEKKEEAKEKAEEKEEKEEKLEEQREEKEEQQVQLEIRQEENKEAEEMKAEQRRNARKQADLLEEVQANKISPSSNAAEAQLAIKEMLQRMKLLEEDLKGASIDVKPENFTDKIDFDSERGILIRRLSK